VINVKIEVGRPFISFFDRKEVSTRFVFVKSSNEDFFFNVSIENIGRFRVMIQDPLGKICFDEVNADESMNSLSGSVNSDICGNFSVFIIPVVVPFNTKYRLIIKDYFMVINGCMEMYSTKILSVIDCSKTMDNDSIEIASGCLKKLQADTKELSPYIFHLSIDSQIIYDRNIFLSEANNPLIIQKNPFASVDFGKLNSFLPLMMNTVWPERKSWDKDSLHPLYVFLFSNFCFDTDFFGEQLDFKIPIIYLPILCGENANFEKASKINKLSSIVKPVRSTKIKDYKTFIYWNKYCSGDGELMTFEEFQGD